MEVLVAYLKERGHWDEYMARTRHYSEHCGETAPWVWSGRGKSRAHRPGGGVIARSIV